MRRQLTRAALLALIAGSPCLAQSPGTVELGVFGHYSIFDDKLQLENALGAGGRLGIFLVQNLAVEGDATWVPTKFKLPNNGKVTYRPLAARLVYNAPISEYTALLLGAGYQRSIYDIKVSPVNPTKRTIGHDGITGLVGLRYAVTPSWSLRGDVVGIYHPKSGSPDRTLGNASSTMAECNPSNPLHPCPDLLPCGCTPSTPANGTGRESYWNWGVRLGLSFLPSFGRHAAEVVPPPPPPTYVAPPPPPIRPETVTVVRPETVTVVRPETVSVSQTRIPITKEAPRGIPVRKQPTTAQPSRPTNVPSPTPTPSARGGVPQVGEAMLELSENSFEPGGANLTLEGVDALARVADVLSANPSVAVELSGHVDSASVDFSSVQLTRRRVEAVRAFLRERGLADSRMTIAWYGATRPIAPNSTAEGRAMNRRVEIRRTR